MEVACSIAGEMAHAFNRKFAVRHAARIRRVTIIWCAIGACVILLLLLIYQSTGAEGKPPLLLTILTPANLFTGVLLCGLLCLLNLWMDQRFLPKALRLPRWLWLFNVIAGLVFLALGIKGYWDHESRPYAIGSLCVMIVVGAVGATLAGRWITRADEKRSGHTVD
jgi:tellurite resistance protein TehA-like permease